MDTYPDYLCDFKQIVYFNCSYILYDNEIYVEPITKKAPLIITAAEEIEKEAEKIFARMKILKCSFGNSLSFSFFLLYDYLLSFWLLWTW